MIISKYIFRLTSHASDANEQPSWSAMLVGRCPKGDSVVRGKLHPVARGGSPQDERVRKDRADAPSSNGILVRRG